MTGRGGHTCPTQPLWNTLCELHRRIGGLSHVLIDILMGCLDIAVDTPARTHEPQGSGMGG